MAAKKAEAKKEPKKAENVMPKTAPADPMEEYVEIELFEDGVRYTGDVVVTVNGERCQIQRGVPVKVKRKFAEVIKNSEEQSRRAAAVIRELTQGS